MPSPVLNWRAHTSTPLIVTQLQALQQWHPENLTDRREQSASPGLSFDAAAFECGAIQEPLTQEEVDRWIEAFRVRKQEQQQKQEQALVQ